MVHVRRFIAGPPSASPTVLLDVDDHNLVTTIEGTSVTPPKRRYQSTPRLTADGSHLDSAYFDDRQVRLRIKFARESAAAQSAFMHELAQIVARPSILMWQDDDMPEPRFYFTKPADIEVIDYLMTANPLRHLSVDIPAEPYARNLPVTLGPITIRNNPAAAVANPMMYVLPDIEGDAPTELYFEYPNDPDAAHRVLWAMQNDYLSAAQAAPYWKSLAAEAIATSAASYYDQFTRADSALTLGVASPGGGTWSAQAGTWGISTNRAYNVAGVASDWSTAVIPFGQADVIAEVTMETQESAGNAGIVIRSADLNTGIAFLADQAYDIATAAQSATVGPQYTETFETGDVMRVIAKGTRIDVYRQAGGIGSFSHVMTVTTTLYQTNTRHGLVVWGSSSTDARFDNFRLGTQLTFGWTITDGADGTAIGSSSRTLTSATGHAQTIVPTAATMLEWPNLPVGRYRVMVRVDDANAGVELLFWNRPPKQGAVLMRDEAAASALILNSTLLKDWYDLGVVDMPGGAPESDPVYGLDSGVTATALWNFGVYNPSNNTLKLDAIVLIPAGRPGTETQHGSATFPDTYTAKSIYLDGVNNRRYAVGAPIAAPTKRTKLFPTAISGALPEVAPGAANMLHFFATAADPASKLRINDDKALDTVITAKYFPKRLYDGPSS